MNNKTINNKYLKIRNLIIGFIFGGILITMFFQSDSFSSDYEMVDSIIEKKYISQNLIDEEIMILSKSSMEDSYLSMYESFIIRSKIIINNQDRFKDINEKTKNRIKFKYTDI